MIISKLYNALNTKVNLPKVKGVAHSFYHYVRAQLQPYWHVSTGTQK